MITPEALYQTPNALAAFYGMFRVGDRLLLTGHSHQAWPDCGLEGQKAAWFDAAQFLDRKWEHAFAKAELVREGYSRLLDDTNGYIALGPSTHDLLVRFISAISLLKRPRIVTTDGEFHSLRRQLDRLSEEGVNIHRVPSVPANQVVERLIDAVDHRTSSVMVSSVFFQSGHIVTGLGDLAEACEKAGSVLFIDAYHSLNVVPFSIRLQGLENAFITGGGYKYCQLGEGNAFLRIPKNCEMRPIITGWFSEFGDLGTQKARETVAYGKGPALFAGSTYDPSSHYRAAEVFSFFSGYGLSPELLREVSQHQIGILAERFDAFDADPKLISRDRSVPLKAVGGFLVLHSPHAADLCRRLFEAGVHSDFRGEALRLGPAPYLSDRQINEAMDIFQEILKL